MSSFFKTEKMTKTHDMKFVILDVIIGLSVSVSIAYWGYFKEEMRIAERAQSQIISMSNEKEKKTEKLISNQKRSESSIPKTTNKKWQGSFFVTSEAALRWLDELLKSKEKTAKYISIRKPELYEFYDELEIVLSWTSNFDDSFNLLSELSTRFKVNVNTLDMDSNSNELYSVTIKLNSISLQDENESNMDSILAKYGLSKN